MRDIPFFPHQVIRELALSSFLIGVLLILAALVPPPLGDEAQPGKVTEVEPQWYLAPLFGFLALWCAGVSQNLSLGVVIPLLVVLIILLIPFIDRNAAGRRYWRIAGAAFVAVMVFLACYAYLFGVESCSGLLP